MLGKVVKNLHAHRVKTSTRPNCHPKTSHMFIGEYQHNLDPKGRLAIPAKFRASLQKGAVVTKGLDGCLVLYPQAEWKKLALKLSSLPINKAHTRAFARLMLAGAWEVEFDRQGRIIIPEYLRSYAKMKKQTIVVGLFNRLELWDETSWNKYKRGTEKESVSIAEQLGELGV